MPKLHDFRAIFFDVDKTLTNSQRQLSPRLIAALQKLRQYELEAGVCTGRSFPSLRRVVLPLFPDHFFHVISGGGQVINSLGQSLWQKTISDDLVREIVEHATFYNVALHIPYGKFVYANQRMINEYHNKFTDENPLKSPVLPIEKLTYYETPLIPAFGLNDEFVNYLDSQVDINFKIITDYVGIRHCDITARGVNKLTGLQGWSQLTGIPLEKVIGIGDSENDEEFLSNVGFSVAMGNATPYIKSIAKRIIGDTDEDGLAIYLEHIMEGNEL